MKYILILLVLLVAGCASGPKSYDVQNRIISSHDYKLILHRATEYLINAGFVLHTIDKDNGMINAEADALALQDSYVSNWDGVNVKYFLADCGRAIGQQTYADKVKLTLKITQSSQGNNIALSIIYSSSVWQMSNCASTGELERQIFQYIETGEILPFEEYKTDGQKKREKLRKEVQEKKGRN